MKTTTNARTYLIATETTAADDTDELAFRVTDEYVNGYGDDRIVVETPAPWDTPDGMTPANEVVKSLNWNDHHYTFDKGRKAWTLDVSGTKALKQAAADAGYNYEDVRTPTHITDDEEESEVDDVFTEVLATVAEGDEVVVRYEKKNGNGVAEYAGTVESVAPEGEGYRYTGLGFYDANGKHKTVKRDDDGVPSIYSSGYHPYMGSVVSVSVTPDTDGEEEAEAEPEAEAEETDARKAATDAGREAFQSLPFETRAVAGDLAGNFAAAYREVTGDVVDNDTFAAMFKAVAMTAEEHQDSMKASPEKVAEYRERVEEARRLREESEADEK